MKQLEDLGLPISKEQRQRLEDSEKKYVSKKLLPSISTVTAPLLTGLHCPVTLLVDYDPEKGIVVKTTSHKIGRCGRKPKGYSSDETEVPTSKVSEGIDDDVILTHPVDWSPFEYGFTIDHKYHQAIFDAVGHYIPRGTGVNVRLIFKGEVYHAKITNANRQVKSDTIRLLYNGKSNNFGTRLKRELPEVYNFIKRYKEQNGGRSQCPLPKNLKHLLLLKSTEKKDEYRIECEAC